VGATSSDPSSSWLHPGYGLPVPVPRLAFKRPIPAVVHGTFY
jgi:hypothetical protein